LYGGEEDVSDTKKKAKLGVHQINTLLSKGIKFKWKDKPIINSGPVRVARLFLL
jgi:hypothetical protein